MELTTEFLHETTRYVEEYFSTEFPPHFSFHNFNRTVQIVRHCDSIGVQMKLKKDEVRVLHLSAMFLETGYCRDYQNSQAESVQVAVDYLKSKGAEDELLRQVTDNLLATRHPQQPVSGMAQVLCDASAYHLADKTFPEQMKHLRTEQSIVLQREYSDEEWLQEIIRQIVAQFFFTPVARELFDKRRLKLKKTMEDMVSSRSAKHLELSEQVPASSKQPNLPAQMYEEGRLERGVETFFRITEKRHMELSNKAHDKASLLISINAIVMSIVLSVLITKLEYNTYLLFPTLLLVVTCVTTIVLAIISTRPRIIKPGSKGRGAESDEINILFFGDFSKLSLSDYKKVMKETYKNKSELYDSLSRDIYYQGIILVWKYKYVNWAYLIFMYGFIVTIIGFIVAFVIHTR